MTRSPKRVFCALSSVTLALRNFGKGFSSKGTTGPDGEWTGTLSLSYNPTPSRGRKTKIASTDPESRRGPK